MPPSSDCLLWMNMRTYKLCAHSVVHNVCLFERVVTRVCARQPKPLNVCRKKQSEEPRVLDQNEANKQVVQRRTTHLKSFVCVCARGCACARARALVLCSFHRPLCSPICPSATRPVCDCGSASRRLVRTDLGLDGLVHNGSAMRSSRIDARWIPVNHILL